MGARITIKYSNGNGLEGDIMYGAGNRIPNRRHDGLVIYRQQFWCPELLEKEKIKMKPEEITDFEAKS